MSFGTQYISTLEANANIIKYTHKPYTLCFLNDTNNSINNAITALIHCGTITYQTDCSSISVDAVIVVAKAIHNQNTLETPFIFLTENNVFICGK